MSGSLEESAPLVDAPASLTATDRAQHQSRRSSLSLKLKLKLSPSLSLKLSLSLSCSHLRHRG